MARSDSVEAVVELRRTFEHAIDRHEARRTSREALARLAQWTEVDWITTCEARIAEGVSTDAMLKSIVSAIGTLEAYQRFRARSSALDPAILAVFALLRERQDVLRGVPINSLQDYLRRLIRREALLAWKNRIETAQPALLVEREEVEQSVRKL